MPRVRRDVVTVLVFVLALLATALAVVLLVIEPTTTTGDGSAPDLTRPTRHFRVPNPAQLPDVEALSIYDRIRDDMVAAYRLSRNPIAGRFYKWRRYNSAPYRSAAHGERYINNYANAAAADDYGRSDAGSMPPGAVLAKDSFTVTGQGDVFTGPLFIMEKMPAGFSEPTRDWRYTMIMPDGSLLGSTKGEGAKRVEFCAACHATAGDDNDQLFFVPEKYRIQFLRLEDDE
jgi:hypothetical protein